MRGTLRNSLSHNQKEIIKAVLYFDVFKYPLTIHELHENCSAQMDKQQFRLELKQLLDEEYLYSKQDYVSITPQSTPLIEKRQIGNEGAKQILPLAYTYSYKIASFPFVEGVYLSGALSKNYYDEKGDIDYFIITKPNRLWICRSLLIIYYKLMPASRKKYWCVNYFISSDNLEIPDKNAFTAAELAFLIPSVNFSLYQQLLKNNNWYRHHYPNKPLAQNKNCIHPKSGFFKTLCEKLLTGFLGNVLESMLLRVTLRRWRRKFPDVSDADFELQFRSQKNVCKRHTHGFQNKVINAWQKAKQEWFSNTDDYAINSK